MMTAWLLTLALAVPTQWAGHQVVWSQVHVPLLGERTVRSDAWVLAEVHEDGDTLRWSERPCRMQMGKVAGVQTRMSNATMTRLPPTAVHMQRADDDTFRGAWNAHWTEDDLDDDGHRGVSLHIDVPLCGGKVYVAMQSTTRAEARKFGDDLLGEMQTDVAQRVLGASNSCLLLGGKDSMQAQQGVFRYTPVTATSCDEPIAWPVAAE